MKFGLGNISLKAKIIGNAVILMSFILLISGYSLISMNRAGVELESILKRQIPLTERLTAITENQLEQAIHFERAIRLGRAMLVDDDATEGFKQQLAAFQKHGAQVLAEITDAKALADSTLIDDAANTENSALQQVAKALEAIAGEHGDYERQVQGVFSMLQAGMPREAEGMANSVVTEEEQLNKAILALLAKLQASTVEAGERAETVEQKAKVFMTALAALAVVLGALLSLGICRHIAARLKNMVSSVQTISSGDLRQMIEVSGGDEISQLQSSMAEMQSRLRQMITKINDFTQQIASAAGEMLSATTQTNTNIARQQSETEQVSTAMHELAATASEVAKSVSTTSAASFEANEETVQGNKVVSTAVTGIEKLASEIEGGAEVIAQVERDSENINKVLDVIKAIAEQTNLLALNAAIEAARAGEQGRGFAVVADEVRTLAGRTQESTAEINELIDKLQSGSRNAVAVMSQSRALARDVVDQASGAGASLSTIAASVSRIDGMSTQIATAAEEQRAVAEDMSSNIVRISEMAKENAAGAEQTAGASRNVATISSDLKALVAHFQV